MLETEDTRELEYKLPNLKITVKKKVFNNNLYTVSLFIIHYYYYLIKNIFL